MEKVINELPCSLPEAGIDDSSEIHSLTDCLSIQINENQWWVGYLVDDHHGMNPLEDMDGQGKIVRRRDDPTTFEVGENEYGKDYDAAISFFDDKKESTQYQVFRKESIDAIAQHEWTRRRLLLELLVYDEQDLANEAESIFSQYESNGFISGNVDVEGVSKLNLDGIAMDRLWFAADSMGAFPQPKVVFLQERYSGGYEISNNPARADAYWEPDDAQDWVENCVRTFRYAKIEFKRIGVEDNPRWVITPHGSNESQTFDSYDMKATYLAFLETLTQPVLSEQQAAELARDYVCELVLEEYNAWATGSMYGIKSGIVTLDDAEYEEYSFEEQDSCWGFFFPCDGLYELQSQLVYQQSCLKKKQAKELESA